jgi:hypothetical protein
VGALEYQHRRAGKPGVDLSRMFVYYNARRMRGTAGYDSGLSIGEGMAAFLAYGTPPESVWPYDPELLATTPSGAAYEQARENVPTEYARVDGLDNIKGALAQKFPVVFGISLPTRCYEEGGATGAIPAATAAEIERARTESGHSMLLVGYDLDAGHFLVRNSWGANWGKAGYCTIPFELFEATVDRNDSWILGRLEATGAFRIERPAVTTAPVAGSVQDMAAKMRDEIRGSLANDIADSIKDIKARFNRPLR